MQVSNEWFEADFPGTPEQREAQSVTDDLQISTRTFTSAVPERIGVYAIKLVQLPAQLWPQLALAARSQLAMTLVEKFGNQIVSDIARPRLFNKPKIAMDEKIPTDDGAAVRRLAFQFKEHRLHARCNDLDQRRALRR